MNIIDSDDSYSYEENNDIIYDENQKMLCEQNNPRDRIKSEIFKNDLINGIIINEVIEKIECKEIREKVCKTSIKKMRSFRERDKKKHPVLSPCSCKKNCLDRVSEDECKKIYEIFWTRNYNERAYSIHSRMSVLAVKRRKLSKGIMVRNASYQYSQMRQDVIKLCVKTFS